MITKEHLDEWRPVNYYEMMEWLEAYSDGQDDLSWNSSDSMIELFFHIPKERDVMFEYLKLVFKKADVDELVHYGVLIKLTQEVERLRGSHCEACKSHICVMGPRKREGVK